MHLFLRLLPAAFLTQGALLQLPDPRHRNILRNGRGRPAVLLKIADPALLLRIRYASDRKKGNPLRIKYPTASCRLQKPVFFITIAWLQKNTDVAPNPFLDGTDIFIKHGQYYPEPKKAPYANRRVSIRQ